MVALGVGYDAFNATDSLELRGLVKGGIPIRVTGLYQPGIWERMADGLLLAQASQPQHVVVYNSILPCVSVTTAGSGRELISRVRRCSQSAIGF